jgi:glycosylphosphatidylinositol transamidase
LKKRGGSIQAALNLEFPDIHIHKLELKIEGANGKLPNLDLFNTIIVICTAQQFECSLESERGNANPDFSYFNKRNKAPIDLREGIENTINMVFRQATGVPSSLHGYFLNHRIEALTISGAKSKFASSKKQNPKQNLIKATRFE